MSLPTSNTEVCISHIGLWWVSIFFFILISRFFCVSDFVTIAMGLQCWLVVDFLIFYGGFVVDIVVVLLCVFFGGGILINNKDLRQNFSNIIDSIKKNIY